MINEALLSVFYHTLGKTKSLESTNIIDDLGGDEFDVVDVIVQLEEKLGISIPEEETFDLVTVSQLNEVVQRHVEQS